MTQRSLHRAVMVAAGLLVFTFLSAQLPAQTLYGTLVGNITDPSGLPVVGATVRAEHSGTGLARETKTNERGGFLFSDLQSGSYDMTVRADSFAPVTTTGLQISANAVTRADAQLAAADRRGGGHRCRLGGYASNRSGGGSQRDRHEAGQPPACVRRTELHGPAGARARRLAARARPFAGRQSAGVAGGFRRRAERREKRYPDRRRRQHVRLASAPRGLQPAARNHRGRQRRDQQHGRRDRHGRRRGR